MRNAQTFLRMETPPLRIGNVLFADGNASFAGGERAFYGWKRLLCGWGTCLLRMETHPLWVGDVPFTDGNAAARTFGRAHRSRPYHFSYGSRHKLAGE